jgi:hypothetical protein
VHHSAGLNRQSLLSRERGHLIPRGRYRSRRGPEHLLSVGIFGTNSRPCACVLRTGSGSFHIQRHWVVGELYLLGHPVLVHLGVLVPNVPLRNDGGKTSTGIVAEIVGVELNWRGIGARTSHSLVLKNVDIS